MPSAAPDDAVRARFIADHDGLLDLARLPVDAPVGIALSGGPDSSALLLLARSCAAGPVQAMTVDHGLRPESADEARAAAALCAMLGVPHRIARVDVGAGSVQAAAREARYAALADWAAGERLAAILTAHHADDQAETVLMRLSRGSGLGGLTGIRAARRLGEAWLLRPLLGWRKAELETICATAAIAPARDPSNADPRYDRTRMRVLLAENDWLDPARLAASARHLAEAETALVAIADERYAVATEDDDLLLRPDPLSEIARRHVLRLLAERRSGGRWRR